MVESGGLENRFSFTRDGGSNPSSSAEVDRDVGLVTDMYTLFIFRCLRTGNHFLGVTTDLQDATRRLLGGTGPVRLTNPELMHIEQYESLHLAHRRMQQIVSRWQDNACLEIQSCVIPAVKELTSVSAYSRH